MLKLTGTTLLVHDQTILEPPLQVFKKFVELYNLAFDLIDKDDSLASAWATNDNFHDVIIAALTTYGLSPECIAKLTSSQLSLLILADAVNSKPGLIFQQNSAYPKLLSYQKKTVILRGLKLLRLLPFNWQNTLLLSKWATRFYVKRGQ